MKLVSSLPNRLAEALAGSSATALADAIGMSKQAISTYVTGKRNPKRPVINAMADALHVSVLWLMGYDVDKEAAPLSAPSGHDLKIGTLMALLDQIPDEKLDVVIEMLKPLAK